MAVANDDDCHNLLLLCLFIQEKHRTDNLVATFGSNHNNLLARRQPVSPVAPVAPAVATEIVASLCLYVIGN